jgi:hypothetical protein
MEIHEKLQSVQPLSQRVFEPNTPEIKVQSDITTPTCSVSDANHIEAMKNI